MPCRPIRHPDAGAVGVVGLALAVGALAISSITSSIGGGGGAPAVKAPEPVKKLLDRVPEPLPVGRKAEQVATQAASKGKKCLSIFPDCEMQSPPAPPYHLALWCHPPLLLGLLLGGGNAHESCFLQQCDQSLGVSDRRLGCE